MSIEKSYKPSFSNSFYNSSGGLAFPSLIEPVRKQKQYGIGGIDSYTKLMLHMNGTNGSTAFTDNSLVPKTLTANGNVQISTSQYKFGNASGLFDGTGDYLSLADSDDFKFGTSNFTIDTWVRLNTLPSASSYMMIWSHFANSPTRAVYMGLYNNAGTYQFNLACYNTTALFDFFINFTISTNTWYHITWVRNGNIFKLFVNGNQVGTDQTSSANMDVVPTGTIAKIGVYDNSNNFGFNGYIDEFRISKGIARWTSNFIPPSGEYTT